ncbi:MAG: hypothetical protein JKY12_01505 [Sneathiella sp.]|nr:hypothetical protein [Sneathiella sp.]
MEAEGLGHIQISIFDPSLENFGIVSTDTGEQGVWEPGDDDVRILKGLLMRATVESGSEEDMAAIKEAVKYLNNFLSAINLGN